MAFPKIRIRVRIASSHCEACLLLGVMLAAGRCDYEDKESTLIQLTYCWELTELI